MTTANYFGYMRISTKEERGLQKFNRQEKKLDRWATENNVSYIYTGRDDASGKDFNRKDWQTVERLIKDGDTIVFPDISRFTRETENGYQKYMELMGKGIELIFIDNPIVSTPYIKNLLKVAEEQDLIAKLCIEHTVKLLLMVELDRVEKERLTTIKRITDGIKASDKKSGRPAGSLLKMSDDLRTDIEEYLNNRSIKQVDLMEKHNISRNTLKKYVELVKADRG